jgi:hypothetical protein
MLLHLDLTGFVRGHMSQNSNLDPNRFPSSPVSNHFLDDALHSVVSSRQVQEPEDDPQQVAGSTSGKGKAPMYQ